MRGLPPLCFTNGKYVRIATVVSYLFEVRFTAFPPEVAMSGSRRNQIVTDQPVQGELLFRALVYWFLCMLVMQLLVMGWLLVHGPDRTIVKLIRESLAVSAPAIFGSVFLLPLVLYDLLRVSNRFVGPINSVRLTLRQLAEGERPARRVYLRGDDFWQELAHYTNVIAEKVESATIMNDSTEDQTADDDQKPEEPDEDWDENEDIPCTDELKRVNPDDKDQPRVLAFANEK